MDAAEDSFDVSTVNPDAVYDVECDVFCPAALGGILNDETIPRLDCPIVCGAANNQLENEDRHGTMLHEAGILYAPDYLVNAGRTIDDTDVLRKGGYNHERARAMIAEIDDRMMHVGRRSDREDVPTYRVANQLAEERLQALDELRPSVNTIRRPQW